MILQNQKRSIKYLRNISMQLPIESKTRVSVKKKESSEEGIVKRSPLSSTRFDKEGITDIIQRMETLESVGNKRFQGTSTVLPPYSNTGAQNTLFLKYGGR